MRRLRPLGVLVACLLALAGCGTQTHHVTVPRTLTAGPGICPGYQTQYGCAAHSPTFGLPPHGLKTAPAPSSVPTREMFDAVTLSTIPAHPSAVAGYLSGNFPTWLSLRAAFPGSIRVPVAIRALPVYPSLVGRMVCLDVEPGDAVPSEAGAWVRGEIRIGVKPCVYANLSTMPAVRGSIAAAGIARSSYFLWVADWTFHPGLIAGYDAVQWTDHALGRNLDESTVSLAFLAIKPAPKPVPDIGGVQHYERYLNVKWAATSSRERNTVMTWDRRGCENPVRRPVCKSSRAHMQLLLSRDQAVYRRQTRGQRDANDTPGRIQGLVHRLDGRGVVRRWL